jgi:NADH dehydrogenase FAD-containing subunit
VTAREAKGGVLVLGGGFAGAYVARLLGKRGATIVSPENFMLYTPMLPEAASGTLEPRHVVVPLRQMCPHAELLLGRATELREGAVAVETEAGSFEIAYEQLVVAVGAVARSLPIPGLAEHALGFKDLADAIHLRNHVLRELEGAAAEVDVERRRRHLTFAFVGAGYAGVESLAELHDLVEDALRYYPGLRDAPQRWVLVDAAPKILPEIPTRLGDYAARLLARRGIEIRTETMVERVEDPPTCQHALRQARRLAANLQGDVKPYRYRMLGQVATLGRYKGIAEVLGIRIRGFPGWFITRSYHLYQLPLLTRKLRVVVDWTTALFFRRDIAELGTLGHPRRLE